MGFEGTASSSEEDSSSDPSLDSSLEPDSVLATGFAGDVLMAADFTGEGAFAEAFVVTGLVGPSSEAEDSSDDSSLDSSLELDVAARVPFVGGAFTAGAFVGIGLDCVGLVAAAPLVAAWEGAPFAGAALTTGFDGSSSESSSLTGFAIAFEIALVAFGDSESLSLESEADSLSVDSEEELGLGGALD